jgi:hypothetical protein
MSPNVPNTSVSSHLFTYNSFCYRLLEQVPGFLFAPHPHKNSPKLFQQEILYFLKGYRHPEVEQHGMDSIQAAILEYGLSEKINISSG